MTNHHNSQNGNAIFLILTAVALFAALGFAFTNTSRNSSGFVSDEEAKAYANQIIAYGNDVKSAVKRLQLRGCSDTQVSFENNVESGYENPNSPTDKSCHVFDVAGGGLQWQTPPNNSFNDSYTNAGFYSFSGMMNIASVGETNDDATTSELSLMTHFLKKNVCQKINQQLNTQVTGKDNPEVSQTGWSTKFIGAYSYFGTRNEPDIIGKKEICVHTTANSDLYQYMKTIIAR